MKQSNKETIKKIATGAAALTLAANVTMTDSIINNISSNVVKAEFDNLGSIYTDYSGLSFEELITSYDGQPYFICNALTDDPIFDFEEQGTSSFDISEIANAGKYWIYLPGRNAYACLKIRSLNIKSLIDGFTDPFHVPYIGKNYIEDPSLILKSYPKLANLVYSEDYTIQFYDNDDHPLDEIKDSGSYKIEISGKGNYYDEVTKELCIDKIDLNKSPFTVTYFPNEYDGEEHTANIYIDDAYKDVLSLEKNITQKYFIEGSDDPLDNVVDAGKYIIKLKINDEKNFTKTEFLSGPYEITSKEIGIIWDDTDVFPYDGESHKPSGQLDGLFSRDEDNVTIKVSEEVNAGNYTANAILNDSTNYKLKTDSNTKDFSIQSVLDFSDVVSYQDHILDFKVNGNTVSQLLDKNYLFVGDDYQYMIQSNEMLNFSNGDKALTVSDQLNKTTYTYNFKLADGQNTITVTHPYDYFLRSDPDNMDTLLGYDRNDNSDTEMKRAKLETADSVYLEPLNRTVEKFNNFSIEDSEIGYTYVSDTDKENMTEDPVNVGNYSIKAGIRVGLATYWLEDSFKITPREYESNKEEIKVEFENEELVYNKNPQKPTIKVTDSKNNYLTDNKLTEGVDYELGYLDGEGEFVSYKAANAEKKFEQTAAAKYTTAVKFMGNYSGVTTIDWTIQKQIISDLEFSAGEQIAYDGNTHEITISQKDGSALPETSDKLFNIFYVPTHIFNSLKISEESSLSTLTAAQYKSAPKNAGNYTAIVMVKDSNYKFDSNKKCQTFEFTIDPKEIEIIPDAAEKTYKEVDPAAGFTCTYTDTLALSEKISFNSQIGRVEGNNAGTYKYVINDAEEDGSKTVGNYKIKIGETENVFKINKKTITPTINIDSASITYNKGAEIKPVVTVKDGTDTVPASEYIVSYENNKNAGTGTVKVKNAEGGNYIVSDASLDFTVLPKSVQDLTVITADGKYIADGVTEHKPAVTVKDGDTVLKEGTDYTVAYSNNINAGTATVTITGKGNYKTDETANDTFQVLSKLDITDVKEKISSIEYDGVQIEKNEDGFEDTYTFETGKKIKITAVQALGMDVTLSDTDDDKDKNSYWYEFTIPDGVNTVKVGHPHDYKIKTVGDQIFGKDLAIVENLHNKDDEGYVLLATLIPEDIYYLDDLSQKVTVKVEENAGVSVANVEYEYTSLTENVELVDGKPVYAGEYKVTAKTPLNGTNYYLTKNVKILPRKYNEKDITITVTNKDNTYSGNVVIPEIIVKDSALPDDKQVLEKGKDYDIGNMVEEEFVPITDETKDYKGKDADNYSVIVKFKGNYSGEAQAKWDIFKAELTALNFTADENLVYNGKAHDAKVETTDADAVLPEGKYKVVYGKSDSTAVSADLTETAPKNAGSYKAYLKLIDDKNYKFAENQATEFAFTVEPKCITAADITIDSPEETKLVNNDWTYCDPITVTDAETGTVLEKGKDYDVERNKTRAASEDLKVLVYGQNNYTDGVYLNWKVVDYDQAKINAKAAKEFDEMVEAIGEIEYTDSCLNAIGKAADVYDTLNLDVQNMVTESFNKLTDYQVTYLKIDNVVECIDAIETIDGSDECKTLIKNARNAYDNLEPENQEKVINYSALTFAESAVAAMEEASAAAEEANTKASEAESSAKQAIADKEAAEEALAKAEDASKQAAEAKEAAEKAQAAAEATAKNAIADKEAAEKALAAAEDAVKQAAADMAAANKAIEDAETAKMNAEKSAKDAENAANAARLAMEEAEKAKENAEENAAGKIAEAQKAQAAAEKAAKQAEEDMEAAAIAAEAAQKAGETASLSKDQAIADKEAAEKAQAEAEEKAEQAIADKETAEKALAAAEKALAAAEKAQAEAEKAQAAAEDAAEQAKADKAAAEDEAKQAIAEKEAADAKTAEEKAAADKTAADKVAEQIKAIGKVQNNNNCENAIIAAKAAYDTLTDDQKALVANYGDLEAAEKTFKSLPKTGMSGMHNVFAGFAALLGLAGFGLAKKGRKEEDDEE